MFDWKRNLIFIWMSQFVSIMGFTFAVPFAPYYIQDLGVDDPVQLKIWVALFAAATPLSLALVSPIWGAAADRYGRRLMLLRANLGAALVLALMGGVRSVEALVALRLLQGALTGTFTASQAMVAVQTPDDRSGAALGSLSAAVFSGAMVGAFLGGWFASLYGYRVAYYVSAGFLFASFLLVLVGTREMPEPEEPVGGESTGTPAGPWSRFSFALPILILLAMIAGVRHFDLPMMPLLVQEIHGKEGVSFWTGLLFAVSGVAGLLSGFILGRMADRVHPSRIGKLTAVGAGLMMIPQGLAQSLPVLFSARFAMMFCSGGLEPVIHVWLAKVTPQKSRGFIFGWASSARSIGWVIAPLMSGVIAAGYNVRMIYFVGAAFFLLLIPIIAWAVRRMPEEESVTPDREAKTGGRLDR